MAEPAANTLQAPVSLTATAHKGLRIKPIGNADHIAKNHFAKIYTPEFSKAGTDYPIIFVKDPDNGVFFAAGMWGLEANENLFVDGNRWLGGYFPASVRCYPFAVQQDPDNKERLFIGIYEKAPIINKDEGNLIFNDDGSETDWMKEVKEFLVRVFQQEEMTKQFVARLDELGLLVSQTLSIKRTDSDKNIDVSGFFIVDRQKLQELPDDKILELQKNGALEIIYHHLMSLESLDKLLRRKNELGASAPAPAVPSGLEGGASAPPQS